MQLKTIEKSLAVFCLATYGEGDPTDNAMEFWEWIQGDVDLAGLNYAVSLLIQKNVKIYLFAVFIALNISPLNTHYMCAIYSLRGNVNENFLSRNV